MFIWEPQVQRIVSFVTREMSVEVIGPRFSGRSTILHGIGDTLENLGFDVVRVRAVISTTGLEALHSALPMTAQSKIAATASPIQTATAFHELVADGRLVIVVDDADRLDDASWTVLESVHRNNGIPLVVSNLPQSQVPRNRRLQSRASHIAREYLEPLTANVFHRLAEDRIGEPLCPALTARINEASAGLPGLALANVESAITRGRVRKNQNYWSGAGDLLTSDIAGLYESLIPEHPPRIRDALELIARAGSTPLETAVGLVGQDALEELGDLGLAVMYLDGCEPHIAVTPPGIETYFHALSPSARTVRVIASATPSRRVLSSPLRPPATQTSAQLAVAERALLSKHRRAVSDARADWAGRATARAALHYVTLLLSTAHEDEGGDKDVAEVLDSPLLQDDDHASEVLLRYIHARWSLQRGTKWEAACAPLRELSERSEAGASGLFLLLAEWEFRRIDPGYRQRVNTLMTRDRFTHEVAALALAWGHVLTGHADAALSSLASIGPVGTEPLRHHVDYCNGVALVAAGRFQDALAHARPPFRRGTASVELASLAAHSWVEAAASFCLGEFTDLHASASPVFATSASVSGLAFGSDRGLLVLVAMSAVALNQTSLALVLTDQVERARPGTEAIPFSSLEWLDGITRRYEGDHSGARAVFERIETESRGRGFHFTAETAAFAACLAGFDPASARAFRERASTLGGAAYRLFIDARLSRASRDGENLYDLVEELHSCGATNEALRFLAVAKRLFRQNGDPDRAHEAVETAITLTSEAAGPSPASIPDGLLSHFTRREYDVIDGIARGQTNIEISKELFVSVRTVESHIRNIRRKAGVTDRQQLGRFQSSPFQRRRRPPHPRGTGAV